jgi:hypothetical protein
MPPLGLLPLPSSLLSLLLLPPLESCIAVSSLSGEPRFDIFVGRQCRNTLAATRRNTLTRKKRKKVEKKFTLSNVVVGLCLGFGLYMCSIYKCSFCNHKITR